MSAPQRYRPVLGELTDKCIDDCVSPDTWDSLVSDILDGNRTRQATDDICEAITK